MDLRCIAVDRYHVYSGSALESRIASDGESLPFRPFKSLENLLLYAVCLLTLAGCGPQSDLLPVEGNVLLDGAPLRDGSIRFTLTGSDKVFTAAAPIEEGQYQLPQAKGLLPGIYHIMISASDENAPQVTIRDPSGRPLTTAPAELIPAEFNTESTKTVEVTPEGENQFSFDIVSK